jgi:hypothetical protein
MLILHHQNICKIVCWPCVADAFYESWHLQNMSVAAAENEVSSNGHAQHEDTHGSAIFWGKEVLHVFCDAALTDWLQALAATATDGSDSNFLWTQN